MHTSELPVNSALGVQLLCHMLDFRFDLTLNLGLQGCSPGVEGGGPAGRDAKRVRQDGPPDEHVRVEDEDEVLLGAGLAHPLPHCPRLVVRGVPAPQPLLAHAAVDVFEQRAP